MPMIEIPRTPARCEILVGGCRRLRTYIYLILWIVFKLVRINFFSISDECTASFVKLHCVNKCLINHKMNQIKLKSKNNPAVKICPMDVTEVKYLHQTDHWTISFIPQVQVFVHQHLGNKKSAFSHFPYKTVIYLHVKWETKEKHSTK